MKKHLKKIIKLFVYILIFLNVIGFFHAYKFTHFVEDNSKKTKSPEKLSIPEKLKILFLGINNPKPKNEAFPSQKYEEIVLQSNKKISAWYVKNPNSKGLVLLFHGYVGSKSKLIDKSDEFYKQGYSTLLVDFIGSGDSEGNQTTIGFKEAEQVKTAFDFAVKNSEKNIYLFGTSMGAVGIMKAITDYKIKPNGIVIECPFGSLYQTVCARFKKMNAPTFPMAGILTFWDGLQNNFWGFGHNPTEYAKNINCPTLLFYGEKDKSVSLAETNVIYKNLKGKKKLIIFKNTGHENYLIKNKTNWCNNTALFLTENLKN